MILSLYLAVVCMTNSEQKQISIASHGSRKYHMLYFKLIAKCCIEFEIEGFQSKPVFFRFYPFVFFLEILSSRTGPISFMLTYKLFALLS